jgi:glucose-6-phosphate isomerase
MENLKVSVEKTLGFLKKEDIESYNSAIKSNIEALKNKSGKGNDFLGWVNLPSSITETQLSEIEAAAKPIREKSEILVVVGIGGSYLGAKAVNDALSNSLEAYKSGNKNPLIIFAGHHIGEDYMSELIDLLDEKSYSIVVISKSGTTTEPALAFRILKNHLENKVGKEEARSRIIAVTDGEKGSL